MPARRDTGAPCFCQSNGRTPALHPLRFNPSTHKLCVNVTSRGKKLNAGVFRTGTRAHAEAIHSAKRLVRRQWPVVFVGASMDSTAFRGPGVGSGCEPNQTRWSDQPGRPDPTRDFRTLRGLTRETRNLALEIYLRHAFSGEPRSRRSVFHPFIQNPTLTKKL